MTVSSHQAHGIGQELGEKNPPPTNIRKRLGIYPSHDNTVPMIWACDGSSAHLEQRYSLPACAFKAANGLQESWVCVSGHGRRKHAHFLLTLLVPPGHKPIHGSLSSLGQVVSGLGERSREGAMMLQRPPWWIACTYDGPGSPPRSSLVFLPARVEGQECAGMAAGVEDKTNPRACI